MSKEYLNTDPMVLKHQQKLDVPIFPTKLEKTKVRLSNEKLFLEQLHPILTTQPNSTLTHKFFEDSKPCFEFIKNETNKYSSDPNLVKSNLV